MTIRKTEQFPPDPSEQQLERLAQLLDRAENNANKRMGELLRWRSARWGRRATLASRTEVKARER